MGHPTSTFGLHALIRYASEVFFHGCDGVITVKNRWGECPDGNITIKPHIFLNMVTKEFSFINHDGFITSDERMIVDQAVAMGWKRR